HRVQWKSWTMPAQGPQVGAPSSVGGPGSSRSSPQAGQVPWVRVAREKEGPPMGPSGQRVRAFPAARWRRAQVTTPVVRGRPRVVDRGVSPTGWSVVIVDHPGAAGPGRAVEVDDVGRRGGACLLLPGVGGGDGDEVLGAAAEDVEDRGDELQGDVFGALVDQTVELMGGEINAALGE